jgi:hypothetical protein
MSKIYTVTARLWDVSTGERAGDLVDESLPQLISPLSSIVAWFSEYSADCPVALEPVSLSAVRVALSRSGGKSAVVRRRFEHDGRKYLVTVQVDGPPVAWTGHTEDGQRVELILKSDAPHLAVGGSLIDLSPLKD